MPKLDLDAKQLDEIEARVKARIEEKSKKAIETLYNYVTQMASAGARGFMTKDPRGDIAMKSAIQKEFYGYMWFPDGWCDCWKEK